MNRGIYSLPYSILLHDNSCRVIQGSFTSQTILWHLKLYYKAPSCVAHSSQGKSLCYASMMQRLQVLNAVTSHGYC